MNGPKDTPVEVFVKLGNENFLLCTLENPTKRQFKPELLFNQIDNAAIYIKSQKKATIHVCGRIVPSFDNEDDMMDMEENMNPYDQLNDDYSSGDDDSSEEIKTKKRPLETEVKEAN